MTYAVKKVEWVRSRSFNPSTVRQVNTIEDGLRSILETLGRADQLAAFERDPDGHDAADVAIVRDGDFITFTIERETT